MSKQTVVKDFARRTITIERSFAADRAKLWRAWSEEAYLSRWWGPREWPATTVSFDFRDGGHWHYYMQGPDGTKGYALVEYAHIEDQVSIHAEDYFSNEAGDKDSTLPQCHWHVTFSGSNPCSLITTLSLSSETDMKKLIEMGFEAGYTESLDKLDEQINTY